MKNLRLITNNLSDTSTITADPQLHSNIDINNLKSISRSRIIRSSNTNYQEITSRLHPPATIDSVVLGQHKLPEGASITIDMYDYRDILIHSSGTILITKELSGYESKKPDNFLANSFGLLGDSTLEVEKGIKNLAYWTTILVPKDRVNNTKQDNVTEAITKDNVKETVTRADILETFVDSIGYMTESLTGSFIKQSSTSSNIVETNPSRREFQILETGTGLGFTETGTMEIITEFIESYIIDPTTPRSKPKLTESISKDIIFQTNSTEAINETFSAFVDIDEFVEIDIVVESVAYVKIGITLQNTSNVEIGRLFIGKHITPKVGASFNHYVTWNDKSKSHRTEAGTLRTDVYESNKEISFKLDTIEERDRQKLCSAMQSVGKSQDIFITMFSDNDEEKTNEYSSIARIKREPIFSEIAASIYKSSFILEEV